MALQIKKTTKPEEKHQLDVNTLLYHNGCLYSGANDGKIMLWDDDLNKKAEVQAHVCVVYSLTAIDDTIFSCSNDGTINAWTLDLKAKGLVHKEECEFWKLAAGNGMLYAGCDQGMIRVFEKEKLVSVYEILEPVKDMIVENNIIFSSKDTDTLITEMTKGSKVTFANIKQFPGRAPICLEGRKLVVTDRTAKGITVYDNSKEYNFRTIKTVENAHEMIINSIIGATKNDEIYAYTGGWDKKIKQWKITEYCKLCAEINVGLVVTCFAKKDGNILFVGADNGDILRVDFN